MKVQYMVLLFIFFLTGCTVFNKEGTKKYNDFYSYLSDKKLDGTHLHHETILWRHWDVAVKPDNRAEEGEYTITEREYDVVVLENDYVALTLLPGYGGRLLSYYNKVSGKEQLYQNPVGTPFGFRAGSFYYDWLMVYGGLFPTFPEPEHGKTWLLPWEYVILEDSSERVAVEMRFTDDTDHGTGIPSKFSGDATGITCVVTYSLEKGSTVAQMDITLINNRDEPVNYEYWTCITFAPGSDPGDTRADKNTKIVTSHDSVITDISPNGMADSNKIKKLSEFDEFPEWADQGILYAHPQMKSDWYGVVNLGNKEGFLRVADNSITKGLKFWTWGYEQSMKVTEENSFITGARPYIELWSGVSERFFKKEQLPSNGSVSWSEYYYSVTGLAEYSYASKAGALFVEESTLNGEAELLCRMFMNKPGKKYTVVIESAGTQTLSREFTQKAHSPYEIKSKMPASDTCTVKVHEGEVAQLSYTYKK